jgi:hypothetical protein
MNVRPTSHRPAALLALTLPLALAACGRVPGQFEILNNQIPALSSTGCMVPVNPTQYLGEGLLDLSIVQPNFESAYLFFPLIENNLPKGSSNNAIDPNEIQLNGFLIDIKPLNPLPASQQAIADVFANAGALGYTHYQIPWSGGVSSGGGHLSAIVEAFPTPLAQQLAAVAGFGAQSTLTVDLQIQAQGTTNIGAQMTSDPFHFPLEVCSGCLVANVMPCPYGATPRNPGNPCNPAQDVAVDCCTESGQLICPPSVAQQ